MNYLRRLAHSFAWLRQPYQWLLVGGLLALALVLAVQAYKEPFNLALTVGGNDAQFVRNANGGNISPSNGIRWMRAHSSYVIPAVSASHAYTLSVFVAADLDKVKDRPYFAVSVNGKRFPAEGLTSGSWYTWRIDPQLVQNGKLNIEFSNASYLNLVWQFGIMVSQLKLTAAPDAGQPIADYAELDWRNIAYLVATVLLLYSFFATARRRWLLLVGLAVSLAATVILAGLLANNRGLFVYYCSSFALGLLALRLLFPLVGANGPPQPARWLFLLTLGVGLLFALPDIQNQDNFYKYLTSESLLLRGTAQIPPPIMDLGSHYSRYALGHAVAEMPLLAVGWGIEQLLDSPPLIRQFFTNLLNPLVSAISVWLLFLCARRLFGSERLATALGLIYFFATFALTYAVQDWTEPLMGMLLLAAFYAMLRTFAPTATDRPKWLLVAGCLLGYMLFSKEEYAFVAVIFALWWMLRRGTELRAAVTSWGKVALTIFFEGLRLAVPVVAFYSLDLAYNYLRNGSLFAAGYVQANILGFSNPLLSGLYGLLFSSGKGLLVFAPPVILCFWAAASFWRNHRWEAGLIGALFAFALLFYATYDYWNGGNSWGPRFLLPYTPLLILVSGAALRSWPQWQPLARWAYAGAVFVGALFGIAGMLTPTWGNWIYGYDNLGIYNWGRLSDFSPSHGMIAHALAMTARNYIQPLAMFQLSYFNFPAAFDHIIPALLLALAGIAAWQVRQWYAAPVPAQDARTDIATMRPAISESAVIG